MQRPPAEIRKMEQERSRREGVHRRLRWQRRLRMGAWVLGAAVAVLLIALYLLLAKGSLH